MAKRSSFIKITDWDGVFRDDVVTADENPENGEEKGDDQPLATPLLMAPQSLTVSPYRCRRFFHRL